MLSRLVSLLKAPLLSSIIIECNIATANAGAHSIPHLESSVEVLGFADATAAGRQPDFQNLPLTLQARFCISFGDVCLVAQLLPKPPLLSHLVSIALCLRGACFNPSTSCVVFHPVQEVSAPKTRAKFRPFAVKPFLALSVSFAVSALAA